MLRKFVSNMKSMSLKKFLQLMHVCGLLSLSDYDKDPRKIQKQKLYTICNLTFLTIVFTSFGFNLFTRTIRNTAMFCENLSLSNMCSLAYLCLCRAKKLVDVH
uniref:Uncharacterized protein n=1 Tax=Cacopsylla melanoneura TaxID=428564 RepID=A0A8D8SHM9_9HEMI